MKRSIYYAMTEKRDAQGNLVPFGFKYNGRTYRLYKRLESEDAPYYIEFQMHGQRYAPCLNTNQRAVAVINAKLELDKAATEATLRRFGHVLPQAQAKRSYATLGAIEDAYRRLADGAREYPGVAGDGAPGARGGHQASSDEGGAARGGGAGAGVVEHGVDRGAGEGVSAGAPGVSGRPAGV
jgi:hypothetical protein